MSSLTAYHRPVTPEQALQLLARPGRNVRIVAGGTSVTPQLGADAAEVVDLQAVGLAEITMTGAAATVGSMTTLQALVECASLPAIVREAARREAPNTFRHVATLGGAIAVGDWESELLAALLACDAQVTLERLSGRATVSLADFLTARSAHLHQAIITRVTLAADGVAAAERTGRTPADKPIVAAVARRIGEGNVRLALAGVAEAPLLVASNALDSLTPPADFRGSSEYRKHLAGVLAQRVLTKVSGGGVDAD